MTPTGGPSPTEGPLGLVVPVFDEAERLGELVSLLVEFIETQAAGSELLFVDDGSRDDTVAMLEGLLEAHGPASRAVRVLSQPHRGKGAAVAAGLRSVRGDYLAFCDVDLSTPLPQFQRVIDVARRAPALAIGSRDVTLSRLVHGEHFLRKGLGRAYNRLIQATVAPGIVDTQCGAKAAARAVWEALLPWCDEAGFAWDAQLVAVALARGVPVLEVPIDWRHDDRSKVRVGWDGAAMVAATPRIWRSARRAAAAPPPVLGPAVDVVVPTAGVFDDVNAAHLHDADRSHWWFRSKAAFVASALRRTASPAEPPGRLVDVGSGSGGVTASLGWNPEAVVVVEGNERLVRLARGRHGFRAVQGAVGRIPLAGGSVGVVCLLDVIEHLADPRPALVEAARVLGPNGRLVVNVPAHPRLWSAADERLGHHRRYTRRSLRRDLGAAGFEPVVLTHVFSWLVPFVWAERRVLRRDRPALGLDRRSFLVDRAALVLTAVERLLVGRVDLPAGTSILAVARVRSPEVSAGGA